MPGHGGRRSPSTARPSGIPVPVSSTRRAPCGRWWCRPNTTAPRSSPAGPSPRSRPRPPGTGWRQATAGRSTPNGSSSPPAGGCPRSWTGSRCRRASARSCHRCRSARRTPTTSPTGTVRPATTRPPRSAPITAPPGRPSSTRTPPSRPTACPAAATPDSADRRSPSSSAGERSPRPPTRTGSSTRRTAPGIVDYVRQYLPGLHPEPYAETTCLFTSTPSEDFLVDGTDGITLVSPCSGHGAKFAPLIGDIAADVATGAGRAPDRFTVRALDAASRVHRTI